MEHPFLMFLDHTQRRSTVGRTPLDEWSARHRDLYLTAHNTHNRQISMTLVGFEPTISAGERPQSYALDRAATGTGSGIALPLIISEMFFFFYFTAVKEITNFTCRMWLVGNTSFHRAEHARSTKLFRVQITAVDFRLYFDLGHRWSNGEDIILRELGL